jgi:hypothetical protein
LIAAIGSATSELVDAERHLSPLAPIAAGRGAFPLNAGRRHSTAPSALVSIAGAAGDGRRKRCRDLRSAVAFAPCQGHGGRRRVLTNNAIGLAARRTR